eukprot:TRINITY_DN51892_c0_g1_i1.p1 TRINITY_DN51892_c0_g1~~TRINITY_DN51892_c0_g1_i1.p1  ORF type:complete len:339 (-),score=19.98 TRINITY_DN51892_c0_g1_i1:76-1017(-)
MKRSHLRPNNVTYSVAIAACSRARRWTLAHNLLNEGLHSIKNLGIVAHSSALSAVGRGLRWDLALTMLHNLSSFGLTPNVVACNTAISACADAARWEHALFTFRLLNSRWALKPDNVSCNAALTACANGKQWEAAQTLLDEASALALQIDLAGYNAAVAAYAGATQWTSVLRLLKVLRERHMQPTQLTMDSLLNACEQAGCRGLIDAGSSRRIIGSEMSDKPNLHSAVYQALMRTSQRASDVAGRGTYAQTLPESIGDHSVGFAATVVREMCAMIGADARELTNGVQGARSTLHFKRERSRLLHNLQARILRG